VVDVGVHGGLEPGVPVSQVHREVGRGALEGVGEVAGRVVAGACLPQGLRLALLTQAALRQPDDACVPEVGVVAVHPDELPVAVVVGLLHAGTEHDPPGRRTLDEHVDALLGGTEEVVERLPCGARLPKMKPW